MISNKGHNMICDLMTAAGKATDKDAMVNAWTKLEDYIAKLEELEDILSKLMDKARYTLCSSQFDELDEYLENLLENK